MRYYRRYFLDAELPEDETMCDIDAGYFPKSPESETEEDWVMVEPKESEEDKKIREVAEAFARSWADYARVY